MPIVERLIRRHPTHDWLAAFRRNVTSACGEDGIVEKMLEIVPDVEKYCVEFGAWDGKLGSNTWNLVNNHDWKAVLIEADPERFKELEANYHGNDRVTCLNRFVQMQGENSLDEILIGAGCPAEPGLISIDIDGMDFHVWKSMVRIRPAIVIVEFNPYIPNDIVFIQDPDPSLCQGCSLHALILLGKGKGYELVSVTSTNAVFVRKELYPAFHVANNAIEHMFDPSANETVIFQLYDGSLALHGVKRLAWHGIEFCEEDIQPLPTWLRRNPFKNPKFPRGMHDDAYEYRAVRKTER